MECSGEVDREKHAEVIQEERELLKKYRYNKVMPVMWSIKANLPCSRSGKSNSRFLKGTMGGRACNETNTWKLLFHPLDGSSLVKQNVIGKTSTYSVYTMLTTIKL